MSTEKERAQVIQKLDDLVVVLGQIGEEIKQVNQQLKATVTSKQPEDIRLNFPEDLADMLTFEDKGDCTEIRPRQFLGSDNFARIASVVRGLGGEYVSAGKNSHFRVPKQKVTQ